MILGKVVGTIIASKKEIDIEGARFLLINICNQRGEKKDNFIVALDLVSAGYDEMVMISQSTPARETQITNNKPIDAIIIGIIDMIDENENVVYKK